MSLPESTPGKPVIPKSERVRRYTHVTLEMIDSQGGVETLEFNIVPDKQADFYSGFLGETTSLAQAIFGKPAGVQVPYRQGDVVCVKILSVTSRSSASQATRASEKRQAKAQEAQEQIERTNAMIFASTYEGKWGGYDPDSIQPAPDKTSPDKPEN